MDLCDVAVGAASSTGAVRLLQAWTNAMAFAAWLPQERFRTLTPARLCAVLHAYLSSTTPRRSAGQLAAGLSDAVAQAVHDAMRALAVRLSAVPSHTGDMEAAAAQRAFKTMRLDKNVECDASGVRAFHVSPRNEYFAEEIAEWRRRRPAKRCPPYFITHLSPSRGRTR